MDDKGKNGRKTFCHREKSFFPEMLFSTDLLGPEEVILSFAQNLSKYLECPYKLITDVCHVR